MLTDILFLFKQYGGSLFLFLLLSFLLGLWLAYLAWRALAHRVAEKQAEYTRLADRVNAMRERRQSLGGPEFKPLARTFAFVDGGGIASTPVDPTAAERKRLEKLAKADFPGENVRIDPALGVLYDEKPEQVDDLSLVRGIGPSLEDKLNDNGVYRFKQISNWSDDHVAGMANKIETSKDRIQRDRWIPQASELTTLSAAEAAPLYHAPERVDHEAKVATAFESESVHVDPSLGIVYDEKPQFGDDLTAIKDIDPAMASTLNSNGVYRYKQMANWSDHNVTEAANKLGINKGTIETDKWVLQARRLHIDTYRPSSSWGIARPSEADYAELIDEEFKGLDVRPDSDLGVLYRSRPEKVDDLKEITGIGKVLETELHDLGIYRFKQIGFWSESTIRAVAQKLDIHPEYIYRDEWIPEARRLYLEADKIEAEAAAAAAALAAAVPEADTPLSAVSGFSTPAASTRIDPKLGVLYTSRPTGLDDLTQISGVGEIIANKLNDFGVYTFEQVANWTPEQCQEFATVLETFKDRIERDNWVGQAKELLAQKQGLG